MNRMVYKYKLAISTDFDIQIHEAHHILEVDVQRDPPFTNPYMWVEVDTDSAVRSFQFAVVGTGHPVPDGFSYVGSWRRYEGLFVWHLYRNESDARFDIPIR